jgi:hypothetical protein
VVHGVKQVPTFVRGAVPDDGGHGVFLLAMRCGGVCLLPLIHPLQHLAGILAVQATNG